MFKTFGVTMLLSTINYICKNEVKTLLASVRRMNIGKFTNESKGKSVLFLILDIFSNPDTAKAFTELFELPQGEFKKVVLFEEMELESLSLEVRKEIRKMEELVGWCEKYSRGKEKESYKFYNLSGSTEVVKR